MTADPVTFAGAFTLLVSATPALAWTGTVGPWSAAWLTPAESAAPPSSR